MNDIFEQDFWNFLEPDIATLGLIYSNGEQDLEIALKEGLREDYFLKETYRGLFASVMDLYSQGIPLTPQVLFDDVKANTALLDAFRFVWGNRSFTMSITYFVQLLRTELAKRQMKQLALEISSDSDSVKDTSEIEDEIYARVESITGNQDSLYAGSLSFSDALVQNTEMIEEAILARDRGESIAISTGIKKLDETLSGGWLPGKLYVLAARTSQGKTTLATCFAHNAVEAKIPTLFFTVEMSGREIAAKILSRKSRVDGRKIQQGELSENEMDQIAYGIRELNPQPLEIVDSTKGRYENLKATLKRLHRKGKAQFVIVDYAQQFKSNAEKFNSRHEELTHITMDLKTMAMELQIPILILAQLNRSADRQEGEPYLSQIKDSGSLEQDADCVMFIHSPEREQRWIVVAKNRTGPTGTLPVSQALQYSHFGDS